MPALLFPLAQSVTEGGHWRFNPQLNPWLLVAFAALAIGLSVVLYLAQSKVASRKAVVALTCIRAALVLLVFLMLLGAARVFTQSRDESGTLYVLVDRSGSMGKDDPYAPPAERLRWADAAGLLPAGARPGAADRQAVRIRLAAADLRRCRDLVTAVPDEATAAARVKELAAAFGRAGVALAAAADALDRDPTPNLDPAVRTTARDLAAKATAAAQKAAGYARPDQAANDFDFKPVTERSAAQGRTAVDELAFKTDAAARAADEAIVASNDPAVAAALDKVGKMKRYELAQAYLDKSRRGAAGFDAVLPRQPVRVITFGDTSNGATPATKEENAKAVRAALGAAESSATDETAALLQAQREMRPNEPSSVVVIGDGRHNRKESKPADEASRLVARGARVYAIGLGSRDQVAPDAAVEALDAPEWVFKGDAARFTAVVRMDNLAGKRAKVGLYRTPTGGRPDQSEAIDVRDVDVPAAAAAPTGSAAGEARPTTFRQTFVFTEKAERMETPGVYDYQVRVDPLEGEVVKENNAASARVAVRDDKLNVLIIDDQPRWEWRYVHNYFNRDARVRVQSKINRPARIGDDPDPRKNVSSVVPRKPSTDEKDAAFDYFQILPDTQEEWNEWDLIVVGDVGPDSLSRAQQTMIVRAVRDNGSSLVFMAGALQLPSKWGAGRSGPAAAPRPAAAPTTAGAKQVDPDLDALTNPLLALLPVEPSPDSTETVRAKRKVEGYFPQLAPEGATNLLGQLAVGEDENARAWARLADPRSNAGWYWHSEYTQARPGASVIWSIGDFPDEKAPKPAAAAGARPNDATALQTARNRALLVTLRAGPGKVMYIDGEATWRLRQVRGVNYHERFWGQVLRWTVDGQLPAGGRFVRFGTDQPRYVGAETPTVTARVRSPKGRPIDKLTIKVIARPVPVPGAVAPTAAPVEVTMTEDPSTRGTYQATLPNLPDGQVVLELKGAEVEQLLNEDPKAYTKSLTIETARSVNVEQRNVNADYASLQAIAEAGGGTMVAGPYADLLAEHVPELSYTTTSAEQIALFTDPTRERYARLTHWVFLGLFVGLISAEWIVRKRAGLV